MTKKKKTDWQARAKGLESLLAQIQPSIAALIIGNSMASQALDELTRWNRNFLDHEAKTNPDHKTD